MTGAGVLGLRICCSSLKRDDRDCEIGAEGVRLRAAALGSGCQAAGYNSQDCEQRWQGV